MTNQPEAAERPAFGPPERRLEIGFRVPADWRQGRLDAWLRTVMEVETPRQLPVPPGCVASNATQDTLAYFARVLALAGGLMHAARFPAFEPMRLLALEVPDIRQDRSEARWRARIAIPMVENVPKRFAEEVLSQALKESVRLSTLEITPAAVDAFCARVDEVLVRPFAAFWLRGKSTLPLLRCAYQRGVPFLHLGGGLFQLGMGSKGRTVERSAVQSDSAFGARVSHDKASTAELLRVAGLPAPRHGLAESVESGLQVARSLGWPVVVKPADRDRGEGVRVDIADEASLKTAIEAALQLSRTRRVIVERQVPGVCHRIFIAFGRLLYAVARHPISVIGDGRSTIRQLVDACAAREALRAAWIREVAPVLDAAARAELLAAGLNETSVPSLGQRVRLRRIESTAAGGFDEDVSARIHPQNLRAAIAAARLFGLDVAGVDIICPDISVPWNESGAIINEMNFAPLLGGGEISLAHIPEFIERLLEGDGRIPVEIHVGAQAAWQAARSRREALRAAGLRAWAVSDVEVLDAEGTAVPLDLPPGALRRARALALRRDVDALIIAASPSEAMFGRWPIECLDRVTYVDEVGVA